MDERTYLTILYDYYAELLTDKQKLYFEDYYFNNLSLGEISENFTVSRNAVHKQIKIGEEKLKDYEEKLKLYEKSEELKKIMEIITDSSLKKQLEEFNNK